MTDERWRRLSELFPEALAVDPDARASFIRQRCPDDPELRHELERLLGFDDRAKRDGFLDPLRTTSFLGPMTDAEGREVMAGSESSFRSDESCPAPGDRVGKYEVVRRLGHGSQGSALLARDADLQALVVLKLYHAADSRVGHEPLLREARALARVHHPNVARCLGIERIGELLVLVVEHIPGRDLSAHWRETPGTCRTAARVMEQLAGGLAAVHACGLLHRDIKPSNVILGDDGEPRLVDFGLVVALGSDTGGVRSGSPAYMAPEQARGEWERVDPRSDVFGLGATLYALLTGRPPYLAETSLATLRQAESCQFPAPRQIRPSIPRGLERICMRAMAAAPERRYASARELELALRLWRRPLQRLSVATAILVGALAVMAAVYPGFIRLGSAKREPAAASPPPVGLVAARKARAIGVPPSVMVSRAAAPSAPGEALPEVPAVVAARRARAIDIPPPMSPAPEPVAPGEAVLRAQVATAAAPEPVAPREAPPETPRLVPPRRAAAIDARLASAPPEPVAPVEAPPETPRLVAARSARATDSRLPSPVAAPARAGTPIVFPGAPVPGEYLHGVGITTAGMGAYNVNTVLAGTINTQPAMKLNEYVSAVVEYLAPRYAQRRQAIRAERKEFYKAFLQRIRGNPEERGVQSGDALNGVMLQLLDPSINKSAFRLEPVPLAVDAVRRIPFKLDKENVVFSMHRLIATGKEKWPPALQDPKFAAERRACESALDVVLEEQAVGRMKNDSIGKVGDAVDDLYRKLDKVLPPSGEKLDLEARNRLDEFKSLARQLRLSDRVRPLMGDLDRYSGTTVHDLLVFMQKNKLRFAGAESPEERKLYPEVYVTLVEQRNRIAGGRLAVRPEEAAAPRPTPSEAAPTATSAAPPTATNPPWEAPVMKRVWDVAGMKTEDEKQLGRALHELILSTNRKVETGPMLRLVEATAEPFVAARTRKDIDYTFTVLDSDAINAFSHPGGYVYVTSGLMDWIGEDQIYALEFLLAHEIAHVDLRHALTCLSDPGVEELDLGTLQQFLVLILPLGYAPDRLDLEADRWAYQQMLRLDRSMRERLAFLRKLEGYARDQGFEKGRVPLKPSADASPLENHLRAHPAPSRRLKPLESLTATAPARGR
jgi:hypothetical protein